MRTAVTRHIRPALAGVLMAGLVQLWNPMAGFAFSFVPMSLTISDSGQGSVGTFRLTNEGTERMAVRVKISTRAMDEQGNEANEDAEDLFTVFPSRFVLEPGGQRALKVQWKGGPIGETERAYRVVAEQVPVEFDSNKKSGITLLFRYVGALYVSGKTVRPPSVGVAGAEGVRIDGTRGLLLVLENRGGTHAIIADPALAVTPSPGVSFSVPRDALRALEGQNILAGSVRQFFVPMETVEPEKGYDVRFTFNAEK